MATLYKRYVPPKASELSEPGNSDELSASPALSEKKRKRDQSAEQKSEKASRKAAKRESRDQEASNGEQLPEVRQAPVSRKDAVSESKIDDTPGAFAHVKSAKKRHKLEKEARKARKAAEKAAQENGATEDNAAVSAVAERAQDEAQNESGDADDVDMVTQEPVDGGRSQTEEQVDGDGTVAATPSKLKKRRHKLEHVLEEKATSADADAAEDNDHLRKHTGILGKFQKSTHVSREAAVAAAEAANEEEIDRNVVHELVIPQIKDTTTDILTEESMLPEWLAKPTVVTGDARLPFAELHLNPETVDRMSRLGFKDALPVQQALVPLLLPPGCAGASFLPGSEPALPDIAVSAPTGSGKTIAYVLPIVEALKTRCPRNTISAVIVVPTRELVTQVAAVADSLAKGSGIRVGMALGSGRFRSEQDRLIRREQQYDSERYQQLMQQAQRSIDPPAEGTAEMELYLDELTQADAKSEQRLRDAIGCTSGHIPVYRSNVDILVATPGRLLEHINETVGFSLAHLQWLVFDEADKLLDNQNEGFLDALNTELRRPRTIEEQDARERYLRSVENWNERVERRVRKVILSATMTRDVAKLSSLELRRPRLVVIRGADGADSGGALADDLDPMLAGEISSNGFELPRSLVEYCVPVGDGSEKPLVMIELLFSKMIKDGIQGISNGVATKDGSHDGSSDEDSEDESESESDSDEDSDSVSSASDSESDDTSSVSSVSDTSSSEEEEEESSSSDDESSASSSRHHSPAKIKPLSHHLPPPSSTSTKAPTILIFTSSNESAHRLTHLLKTLVPSSTPFLTTLTKLKSSKGAHIKSKPHEPAIVISTDRAARGIDSFNHRAITHVIQYDVPRSLTGYVHRVGRTARAGRAGEAWTLYTNTEARWFVNEITKAKNLRRGGQVERVKVFMDDKDIREKYQEAVKEMREEVLGGGGK